MGSVRPQVKALIVAYFAERTGQIVYVGTMATDMNLTEDQIRIGVNNLRNSAPSESGGMDFKTSIAVVARGAAWRYKPVDAVTASPPSGKRLFEEVGASSKGLVIQDADTGTLYIATEL